MINDFGQRLLDCIMDAFASERQGGNFVESEVRKDCGAKGLVAKG